MCSIHTNYIYSLSWLLGRLLSTIFPKGDWLMSSFKHFFSTIRMDRICQAQSLYFTRHFQRGQFVSQQPTVSKRESDSKGNWLKSLSVRHVHFVSEHLVFLA